MDHITEARLGLERLIIDTVALRAGAGDLERLAESVERAAHLFTDGRRAEQTEEDFNFHVLLAEATGNALYPLFIRSVVEFMEPIVWRTGVSDALRRHTLAAHRSIVGHLRRGDTAAAKRELSLHLLEIHARIGGHGRRRRRLGKDLQEA